MFKFSEILSSASYSIAAYTVNEQGSINGLKSKAQNGCCRKPANERVPQVQDKVNTSLV